MVRKAVGADVAALTTLIGRYAAKGIMLPRTNAEIFERLRDFFVYTEDDVIRGACALNLCEDNLAEIRSLAVARGHTGKGIGRKLVEACLDEARAMGIKKVFALTYQTGFFKRLGFKAVNKDVLPQKIWQDCIKCAKFPSCDENAVTLELVNLEPGLDSGEKKPPKVKREKRRAGKKLRR
ncbi:MAG: N-acetyltransferase [Deltaproteobacteria bacterium]|nr:N-acetyltransferase [Deltaproteobacteria bacterium]